MEKLMQQLQDLASAGYVKTTQESYMFTAKQLSARFGVPLSEISREQVREFVDETVRRNEGGRRRSRWPQRAGGFLYRKTIGKPGDGVVHLDAEEVLPAAGRAEPPKRSTRCCGRSAPCATRRSRW